MRNRTRGSDEMDFSVEETEYQCPNCSSERVTSVPLIYASGTSKTEAFTPYVGNGENYGIASTFGTTQTLAARQLAPPKKHFPQVIGFILMGLLFLGFGAFVSMIARDAGMGPNAGLVMNLATASFVLSGILGVGGCFWTVRRTQAYNQEVWEPQYEQWQSSFLCQRCGTVFEP